MSPGLNTIANDVISGELNKNETLAVRLFSALCKRMGAEELLLLLYCNLWRLCVEPIHAHIQLGTAQVRLNRRAPFQQEEKIYKFFRHIKSIKKLY